MRDHFKPIPNRADEGGTSVSAIERMLWVFNESELPQWQDESLFQHKLTPALLREECIPLSSTNYCISTPKIHVRGRRNLEIIAAHHHKHTYTILFGTEARLNLVNKAFLNKEWVSNIKNQLNHSYTLPVRSHFVCGAVFLILLLEDSTLIRE